MHRYRELHRRASGLAQPAHVLDLPGGYGKVPLVSPNLRETSDGYELCDQDGQWRAYPRDGA